MTDHTKLGRLEAVARAIAGSEGYSEIDGYVDENWQYWTPEAQAALAAIEPTPAGGDVREPTEDMLIAGNAVMDEYANEQIDRRREVRDVFKAMIKVAPEALTVTPASGWRDDMENVPELKAVLYFLPHSVTGYFDTCDVAMKISNSGDVSYWTALGPNSGDDITDWIEQATHWMQLPEFPKD